MSQESPCKPFTQTMAVEYHRLVQRHDSSILPPLVRARNTLPKSTCLSMPSPHRKSTSKKEGEGEGEGEKANLIKRSHRLIRAPNLHHIKVRPSTPALIHRTLSYNSPPGPASLATITSFLPSFLQSTPREGREGQTYHPSDRHCPKPPPHQVRPQLLSASSTCARSMLGRGGIDMDMCDIRDG